MAFVRIHLTTAAPGCQDIPGDDFARWPVIPEPTPAQVIWRLVHLLKTDPNEFILADGGEQFRGYRPDQTLVMMKSWLPRDTSIFTVATVYDGIGFADLKAAQADVITSLKTQKAA